MWLALSPTTNPSSRRAALAVQFRWSRPSLCIGVVVFGLVLPLGAVAQDDYAPTSAYIEKGADRPSIIEVAFGGGVSGGLGLTQRSPLSEEAFAAVMSHRTDDLMACYLRGLKRDPSVGGKVGFHFRIASDGHAAMVQVVHSELRTKRIEDCFVDTARSWRFPRSSAQLSKFDTELVFFLD